MHRGTLIAGLVAGLCLPTLGPIAAQDAPTAAELVASVQAFYDAHPSIRSRFTQHFWMRAYQRSQSSRGRIALQRPGRIRFDYDAPSARACS